jgi:RNA polymerase sigma-70 factor (ECF subfamily)
MNGVIQLSSNLLDINAFQPCTAGADRVGVVASPDDSYPVELLRRGNEDAFALLVDRYSGAMVRLAMVYVSARAVAEEVVQETWLAVLEGLYRFEERSSLKTWMFRILTNIAKTRAQREGRSVPFSLLADMDSDDGGPVVDPERFLPAANRWAGHWTSFPSSWEEVPERRLLSGETFACIERAIEGLPAIQRQVILLRDIEGWSSDEACHALGISEGNQRVLLHRARSKVRTALERYFADI